MTYAARSRAQSGIENPSLRGRISAAGERSVSIGGVLIKTVLVASFYAVATVGTPGVLFAIGVTFALLAMRGAVYPLVASLLLMLLVVSNSLIVDRPVNFSLVRIVFFAAFVMRAFLNEFPKLNVSQKAALRSISSCFLFIFSIFLVTSLAGGYYFHISFFKLVQFLSILMALLVFVFRVGRKIETIKEWILAALVAVLLGSWAILFVNPALGYKLHEPTNTLLFQGLINQPQSLAVFLSMFAIFAFQLITSRARYMPLVVLLSILAVLAMLWMTRSRTGALGLVGILSAVYVLGAIGVNVFEKAKSGRRVGSASYFTLIALALAGVVFIFLFADPAVISGLLERILKWSKDSGGLNLDNIISSRVSVIDESWSEFLKSPLIGIGFGVERSDDFIASATLFSAPSEKSFWPTAVLHETGVLGLVSFLAFVTSLISFGVNNNRNYFVVMIVAFLVFNFGEFNFFSLGSIGYFCWFLILSTVPNPIPSRG